jgi:hypothetical protein
MGLIVSLSACGFHQPIEASTLEPSNTNIHLFFETKTKESFPDRETADAIPPVTPLPGPCATPGPDRLQDVINISITAKDNGKTFIFHVTSRFWFHLDDSKYPLRELLKSIPDGLIGYVSNGSIRGPQCYPIMFEAVQEGRALIQLNDFRLSIIVDNNLPESVLPPN